MSETEFVKSEYKTWDKTRSIMNCAVMAFFCSVVVMFGLVFKLKTLPFVFLGLTIYFIIMTVHNAWILEETL